MLGKHHTKKARKKMSEARLGKHCTKERKKQMRDAKLIWYQAHPEANKGENNPRWKGGRTIDSYGYVLIHAPDHPYANNRGYVKEHRLIMEQKIGRYLCPWEVVHHHNEIKDDNRPENLDLFSSGADHTRFERSLRRPAEVYL